MFKIITVRTLSILGCLICAGALVAALYLENEYMLSPCPLCMLQRIVFGTLACAFVIGALVPHLPNIARYVYITLITALSGIGLAMAARQFWLQYYAPKQSLSCSAGLTRLIETYPFLDALKIALSGTAECSTIDFTIFTISIAGWSVILFGLFVIVGLYALCGKLR